MTKLAIRVGDTTHYYDPQKDYDRIYDCLTEAAGWSHIEAEEAASWAEMAYYEDEYETDDPNVEIYFIEE